VQRRADCSNRQKQQQRPSVGQVTAVPAKAAAAAALEGRQRGGQAG
jgi:hypothetical protein